MLEIRAAIVSEAAHTLKVQVDVVEDVVCRLERRVCIRLGGIVGVVQMRVLPAPKVHFESDATFSESVRLVSVTKVREDIPSRHTVGRTGRSAAGCC